MTLHLLAVLAGCLLLYFGGDLLVRGASVVGRQLGLSPALIGLLLVSLGTSAPELFVSGGAALQGLGDIAAGNALGSNIVNLCLVLGLGAVLAPLAIEADVRIRQLPLMLVLTAGSTLALADGGLGRVEGVLLLGTAALGLWWITRRDGAVAAMDVAPVGGEEPHAAGGSSAASDAATAVGGWLPLVGGVVLLLAGAEALIFGGVGLAAALGVPDAVIALTVTSIGTGLPEITATVIAAARREHAMAIGNVVGSNIMNLGLVLGGSALLRPFASGGIDGTTFVALGGFSVLLLGLAWWPGKVTRPAGIALILAYLVYVVAL